MNAIKKLIAAIKRLFTKAHAPEVAPTPRVNRPRVSADHFGAHYYLGDILDNAKECIRDMRKLKSADREAYDLFSRTGAAITNSKMLFTGEISAWLKSGGFPSFGCIHMPKTFDGEWISPTFMYFNKVNDFANVQPHNGSLYRIGAIAYLSERPSQPFYEDFFVSVDGNGNVRALKICRPETVTIDAKRKRKSEPRKYKIQRLSWSYPRIFQDAIETKKFKTEDECASFWFWHIANASEAAESGMTVRVSKGRDTAAFAIDMLRTPYFFADREKTTTDSGATKRIFHYVKGHYRGDKFIKPHFRGLRTFTWNGFRVHISMPGRHHAMMTAANFYAVEDRGQISGGHISTEEAGDLIAEHIYA